MEQPSFPIIDNALNLFVIFGELLGLVLIGGYFGYPGVMENFPRLWEYVVNPLNIWNYL